MTQPIEKWVSLVIADEDSPFAIPEIAVKMPVTCTYDPDRREWTARSRDGNDTLHWTTADTQDAAIVRVLASRIGAKL